MSPAADATRPASGAGAAGAGEVLSTQPRRPRSPVATTWRAPDEDALRDEGTPLERAGARAKALVPDDPDLVRVRTLLADLRPDCADPWEPPAAPIESTFAPMPSDPTASHGGIPRGYGTGDGTVYAPGGVPLVNVFEDIDALDVPHPAVLRWARSHASLGQGLRGLFVDAGEWAAMHGLAPDGTLAAWDANVGVRREGAYALGRYVMLRAATAWRR